jgi:hypothetical protein
MTKAIYILTEGVYEDKETIGVYETIELASFAKEQFDKHQFWEKDKSTIEEYTLNYCWELERILTEDDKPENVIDPATLQRRYGVE